MKEERNVHKKYINNKIKKTVKGDDKKRKI